VIGMLAPLTWHRQRVTEGTSEQVPLDLVTDRSIGEEPQQLGWRGCGN
jgi:hypothetical protein